MPGDVRIAAQDDSTDYDVQQRVFDFRGRS
jgi:hypothetical protein